MAQRLSPQDFGPPRGYLKPLVIGIFFLGIFLLAVGSGLFFLRNSNESDDIQIIAGDSDTGSEKGVVVHVDGAVVAPGVYRLDGGSRVDDAIRVAGGLTADADQTRINLAAKVADGQKIYVFARGENIKGTKSIEGIESIEGLININTATESELDRLPGVGPVTAGKIIASRPYSAPEDLLAKKAVSKSVFDKIRDLISTY